MNRPPGGSAQPLVLNSLDQLSRALDSAADVPPPPTVKVTHLPDTLPSRKRMAEAAKTPAAASAGTAAPWWVDVEAAPASVDVEPAPASVVSNAVEPVVVIGELDEEPAVAGEGLIQWRVVGSVAATAVAVLGVVVFGAWATTSRATPVAQAKPEPVAVAPAKPQADQKLAEIESKYQELVAKLDAVANRPADAAPVAPAPAPKEEPPAPPTPVAAAKPANTCYGTAVNFAGSPIEAAEAAAKDKKLLMVLTISGNFEEAKFT